MASCLSALAQRILVNGIVTDELSGAHVSYATVAVAGSSISVVTNSDGRFTLKLDELPPALIVSHIGYKTKRVRVSDTTAADVNIRLTPASVMLSEIRVWTSDPEELVRLAMSRIPKNYSNVAELYKGFYRETAILKKILFIIVFFIYLN